MNEENRPNIEKFIQGKLSRKAEQAFQETLEANTEFADEVSFRSDLAKTIKRKKIIDRVHTEVKINGWFKKDSN